MNYLMRIFQVCDLSCPVLELSEHSIVCPTRYCHLVVEEGRQRTVDLPTLHLVCVVSGVVEDEAVAELLDLDDRLIRRV